MKKILLAAAIAAVSTGTMAATEVSDPLVFSAEVPTLCGFEITGLDTQGSLGLNDAYNTTDSVQITAFDNSVVGDVNVSMTSNTVTGGVDLTKVSVRSTHADGTTLVQEVGESQNGEITNSSAINLLNGEPTKLFAKTTQDAASLAAGTVTYTTTLSITCN